MLDQQTKVLVQKIQNGDKSSLNPLLKLWYSNICQYAYRYTGSKSLSEEICQQTFITVFKKLDQLDDPAKFKSWLYTIVINGCRNHFRTKKNYESIDNPQVLKMSSAEPGAFDQMVSSERKASVKKALQFIPEDQRTVIILKVYQGLKFREISDLLDISENTVKARMYYGLTALKKTLVKGNHHNKENYEVIK